MLRVGETIKPLNRAIQQPHGPISGLPPIGDVQLTTGLENTQNFPSGLSLVLEVEVVKKQARQYTIKMAIGVRKFVRKSAFKTDVSTC